MVRHTSRVAVRGAVGGAISFGVAAMFERLTDNVHVLIPEMEELTMYNAPQLLEEVRRQEDVLDTILDMGGLRYVDSSGVGVMLKIESYLREKLPARHLTVLRPHRAVRSRRLELSGVSKIIPIFESVPAALEHLTGQRKILEFWHRFNVVRLVPQADSAPSDWIVRCERLGFRASGVILDLGPGYFVLSDPETMRAISACAEHVRGRAHPGRLALIMAGVSAVDGISAFEGFAAALAHVGGHVGDSG